MPGTKWVTADIITFARMNQKTIIVQAAEPAIMYAGMYWVDTDDNMSYQRNAANNAWYTILKEELAYTITGLHTFDRGAAPPFAINAAATRVVNLISDVHAPDHKDGGADELDVSELAGAIGAAGEIPETDGNAVTWVDPDGRYDPKAHILGTGGPHSGTLPLTDLVVGARGEIIHRGVADWAALGVGADGEVLMSGGAGADVAWEAHDKALHDALSITPEEMDPSPDVNDTGSELHITTDTVGENVDPGEVLYLKGDGKYWLADADGVATMPVMVMAMETILADAAGKLLHSGYFRHDAWNWAPGNGEANLLWASVTPGAMSQTQPVGVGDQVQVLGYVRTADIVFFNPSYELVEVPA